MRLTVPLHRQLSISDRTLRLPAAHEIQVHVRALAAHDSEVPLHQVFAVLASEIELRRLFLKEVVRLVSRLKTLTELTFNILCHRVDTRVEVPAARVR